MNKILNEGGNIFKGPSGGSETIRIKREDSRVSGIHEFDKLRKAVCRVVSHMSINNP